MYQVTKARKNNNVLVVIYKITTTATADSYRKLVNHKHKIRPGINYSTNINNATDSSKNRPANQGKGQKPIKTYMK